jgi:hypothetical protein
MNRPKTGCQSTAEVNGALACISAVLILLATACSAEQESGNAAKPESELSYAQIRTVLAEDYAVGPDGKFASPVAEERFQLFQEIRQFRGCTYGSSTYNPYFGLTGKPVLFPTYEEDGSLSDPSENPSLQEEDPAPDPLDDPNLYITHWPKDKIEETAIIDVQISSYLKRMGLPEEIYEKPLAKWIADSRSGNVESYRVVKFKFKSVEANTDVESEIPKLDAELIKAINTNIERAGLSHIILLEADFECGAGDIAYRLQTVPKNSTVSIIQTWNFKLCKARKIDPYDKTKCDGWRDFRDGQRVLLAGDYKWSMAAAGATPKNGNLVLIGEQTPNDKNEIPLRIEG